MTQPIAPAGPRTLQLAGQPERTARDQAVPAATAAPQHKSAGADRVSISIEARQQLMVSVTSSSSVSQASGTAPGAAPTDPAQEAASLLQSMRDAFFTRSGEDGFNAELDFNRDGVINIQDVAVLRQKVASAGVPVTDVADPAPDTSAATAQVASVPPTDTESTAGGGTLDPLRAAFYTREGDDGFNAAVDFNNDGVINAVDLGLARRGDAETTQPVPPTVTSAGNDGGNPVKETLNDLLAAFYTREGEDGYNAAVDFNNDGVINVRDLAMARAGSVTGDADFTQPVAPQTVESSGFGERARTLVQQLREAFYSSRGESNFSASLDANGDGRINVADLVGLRNRLNQDS